MATVENCFGKPRATSEEIACKDRDGRQQTLPCHLAPSPLLGRHAAGRKAAAAEACGSGAWWSESMVSQSTACASRRSFESESTLLAGEACLGSDLCTGSDAFASERQLPSDSAAACSSMSGGSLNSLAHQPEDDCCLAELELASRRHAERARDECLKRLSSRGYFLCGSSADPLPTLLTPLPRRDAKDYPRLLTGRPVKDAAAVLGPRFAATRAGGEGAKAEERLGSEAMSFGIGAWTTFVRRRCHIANRLKEFDV